jgi:multidrug resistance efflux pump
MFPTCVFEGFGFILAGGIGWFCEVEQRYREGAVVEKGQVLFQIDPRPFQAPVDQAQAQLGQAQAQAGQVEAQVEQQQAALEEAQAPLARKD